MNITTDQYQCISILNDWWRKYSHQMIDIDARVGSGINQVVRFFIQSIGLDQREVAYLSLNQKHVLDLAYRTFHAYYLYGFLYKYTRTVDMDTLPVINPESSGIEVTWKKSIRKVDKRYKLLVVYDSSLLNQGTIHSLASLGLPIILLRDSQLLPSSDTFTFLREPNVRLEELNPDLGKNPLLYFAHKVSEGLIRFREGNYGNITIITKQKMNLYNLKSSDMVLTLTDENRKEINTIYREYILKRKNNITIPNEKVIIRGNLYNHILINSDENKIKLYLREGLVGYLTKVNKHALTSQHVPVEFRPEFYEESFTDMALDRKVIVPNQEFIEPIRTLQRVVVDNIVGAEYAYALTPDLARLSYWDKVILMMDDPYDFDIMRALLYSAITRAKDQLIIVL